MAQHLLIAAFGMLAAGSAASATMPEPPVAPAGTAETRYCMRIEITGSRIEEVKCWTRAKWTEEEVDVDKEWASEGVRVIA